MKRFKSFWRIILCAAVILYLPGCGMIRNMRSSVSDIHEKLAGLYSQYFEDTAEAIYEEDTVPALNTAAWTAAPENAEDIRFSSDTEVLEEGETIFAASIDDFIQCFNSVYRRLYGADYLSLSSDWTQMEDTTPYFEYDAVLYRFSANEQVSFLPTISVYAPENGDGIYEIKLTFDDHGYQASVYEEFEAICLCALQTVLPAMSGTEISELYGRLYSQTEENYWGDYYTSENAERPVLDEIYQYGSVGFYGYYGAGTANICILPLTPDTTGQLEQDGVTIIAFDTE